MFFGINIAFKAIHDGWINFVIFLNFANPIWVLQNKIYSKLFSAWEFKCFLFELLSPKYFKAEWNFKVLPAIYKSFFCVKRIVNSQRLNFYKRTITGKRFRFAKPIWVLQKLQIHEISSSIMDSKKHTTSVFLVPQWVHL